MMMKILATFALTVLLATAGYSQQALRDDGYREELYVAPFFTPQDSQVVDDAPKDEDGVPIPDVWIESWIEMKSSPFGERYNIYEWELMKAGYLYLPEYYEFEDGTNNAGLSTT